MHVLTLPCEGMRYKIVTKIDLKKVLRETQTCALALYNLIVHSSAAA